MEQGIVASFRDNNIRATVHFYNSDDDIDHFVTALAASRTRHHPDAR
jgi:selenocysteine lyase/cysteine desulfurase